MLQFEREESVRDARQRYFDANGFGDGGYDARWVVLKVFGLPLLAFPNTKARVRSVRLHDLHHVATGYDTSWTGEAEIAAWELASGCRDHYAAWGLNAAAMAIGLFLAPRRVLAAFRRGRRSHNLYGGEWDGTALDESVGALRARLLLEVA